MSEKKTVIVEGKLFWAKVHKPEKNLETGKDEFKVDVSITNKEKLKELKDLGIPIHNKDAEQKAKGRPIQGNFIRLKSQFKPDVVDAQLNSIPADTLLGNGTKAIVKTSTYTYKPRQKEQSGVGLNLQVIQVVELVPYENKKLQGLTPQQGFIGATENLETNDDTTSDNDEEIPF
jgi:hypothetical protein